MIDKWNPKKEEHGTLKIVTDYGFGSPNVVTVSCSEGGSIFITKCPDGANVQHIALTRLEMYDIIFNYINTEELSRIIEERKKANKI